MMLGVQQEIPLGERATGVLVMFNFFTGPHLHVQFVNQAVDSWFVYFSMRTLYLSKMVLLKTSAYNDLSLIG